MSGINALTGGGSRLIFWDTSVLISFIKNDKREAERLKSAEQVFQEVKGGGYKLLFSTLIYPEVLESVMSQSAMKKLKNLLKDKQHMDLVDPNINIMKKAQEIRNRRKSITTPDAIHLATAIVYKADGFHTFDDALLGLNGRDDVEGLAITACSI